MKTNILKWFFMALPLLSVGLASCEDDEGSDLAAVTNVTYEPTAGGAIIYFTPPLDNNLLYVKAAYTNSQGEEIYNAVSVYDTKIEIEGLADENKSYPVRVIAVDKDGGESPITTINVTPGRSYINLVKDNITIKSYVGGVQVEWENVTQKTVYAAINYTPVDGSAETVTRYVTSKEELTDKKLRGITPGLYNISYQIEDFYGNKTEEVTLSEPVEIKPEIEFPKYTDKEDGSREYIWSLVSGMTTLKNTKWSSGTWGYMENNGSNEAIFDGVIDSNSDASSHSYTSVRKGDYDGRFPFDTDQMDIVVDLGDTYVISRIKSWQRAYWWGWQNYAYIWDVDTNMSWDYLYYYRDNLKTFRLYGTPSLDQEFFTIQECEIADPTNAQYTNYGSDGSTWYSKKSDGGLHTVTMPSEADYQRAKDGHEWELKSLSEPVRYIKIRYVSNFNKTVHDHCHGISELTLYGAKVSAEEQNLTEE